jgi:hypothetical protein
VSRRALVAAVVAFALSASGPALAARGYRVWGSAWHRPPSGTLFTVLAHGVAPQKALLFVYLDRQPCRWTWASEANRFPAFEATQSYFRATRKAFITLGVSGHFSEAFTARAGTTAEPEYACSYLTTPNAHGEYRITAARRSNAYFVMS